VRRWFPDKLAAAKGKGAVDSQNFDRLVRAYQDLKKPKKLLEVIKSTSTGGETEGTKAAAA
jgi:hypothetical protein